ncbi:MAG TPA: exo-alpha-sialidase, partial [Armatimonadota bacterium]|nr:exo-alpha-sialidase [Armatimonadota bacterium]
MTPLGYELDLQILSRGHHGNREWFTPRVGVIPPYTAVLLMSPSSLHGSDVFYTMHAMRSDDLGATWSQPIPQPGLGRTAFADDVDICPCDMVPGWHAATGRLLALGNTACYRPGEAAPISDNSQPIFASYAVY